jgi:endonuclease YncB( thermonuclease family)
MKQLRRVSLLIFILALTTLGYSQSTVAGKVVQVLDGKTVVIEISGGKLNAELQYIEVPDPDQQLHGRVSEHLEKLVLNKDVEFRSAGFAPGKTFGQLYVGSTDVAVQMLRDGAAWHVPADKSGQDAVENAVYKDHQDQARSEKRGVWGIDGMKPAWEHRAAKIEAERLARIEAERAAKAAADAYYEKAAAAKTPVRKPGVWGDENPWLKNPGALVHGYNAASGNGYVGTSLLGVKELENQPTDRKTAVDITYIYKQDGPNGRKGTFVLSVVSSAADWQFVTKNGLTVTVDEKTVLVVKPKRTAVREEGRAVEKLTFEVNKATLEKIVYGGEVFVKVGDLTFYPTQGFQLLLYNILQVAE